jgi:hypothetical protein
MALALLYYILTTAASGKCPLSSDLLKTNFQNGVLFENLDYGKNSGNYKDSTGLWMRLWLASVTVVCTVSFYKKGELLDHPRNL